MREPLQCRREAAECGALSAQKPPMFSNSRHQGTQGVCFFELIRNGLSSVRRVTEDRLRTRKPFIHAVVALSSVVAVQMSLTRRRAPMRAVLVTPLSRYFRDSLEHGSKRSRESASWWLGNLFTGRLTALTCGVSIARRYRKRPITACASWGHIWGHISNCIALIPRLHAVCRRSWERHPLRQMQRSDAI